MTNKCGKIHIQIVAVIMIIVIKRKIQKEASRPSYKQKGAILQYFICDKNTIKVGKMPFFLDAKQSLNDILNFTCLNYDTAY